MPEKRAGWFKVQPEIIKATDEAAKVLVSADKGVLVINGYTYDGTYKNATPPPST